MTWTQTVLNMKDSAGNPQPIIAYTDGTNFSFAHPLLDHTGTIVGGGTALPLVNGGKVVTGGTVTRPADTTAYAFGDLVANNTVAANVTYPTIAAARGTDIVSVATRCQLKKTGTSVTNAIFRVHFYNAQPAVSNGDNAAWLTGSANYLGYFDITCSQAFTDAAIGNGVPGAGSAMTFAPATGTSNLFFLIEARGAYTPISSEVFTVSLEVN